MDSISNEQSELMGFTFYMVYEDKEILAKFVTATELYLKMINSRVKPNIQREAKWKTILGKDEIERSQVWQNLHKNKI